MPARYRGRVGAGRFVRVEWYPAVVKKMTVTVPAMAHEAATVAAARAAAAAIGGRGTGALKRDVGLPKRTSPFTSDIGSDLPYARIQHYGGVITAKKGGRLLIHASRRGPSGQFAKGGGQVTASAQQVVIRGKRYLDKAGPAYKAAIGTALAAGYSG